MPAALLPTTPAAPDAMKVYVISLRRATERRRYIETHLTALGLDYEIVDATDYQQLTPADFATLVDQQAAAANPYLTKGVQACALSHAKVCERVAAGPDRVALVLEDDAALPATIKATLALLEKEIKDDEIISLSYYTHFHDGIELSRQGATKLADGSSLFYPVNLLDVGSAMAYLLPRAVATRLPAVAVPVRVAADYWGDHYRNGAFRSFRCLHPIPAQPATFRSTLDYTATRQSLWQQTLTRLAGAAAILVRKTRFPVLFQYLEKRDQQRLDKKYLLRFVDAAPFTMQ